MFDCVIVDFQNKNSSLKYLSKIFPHAKIIPFIESYNYIINKVINEISSTCLSRDFILSITIALNL